MVDAAVAGLNIIDEKRHAPDVIEMSCRKQKAPRPGRDVANARSIARLNSRLLSPPGKKQAFADTEKVLPNALVGQMHDSPDGMQVQSDSSPRL